MLVYVIVALVIIGLIIVAMYVPAIHDVISRIESGQWFDVDAEKSGEVLKVEVSANKEASAGQSPENSTTPNVTPELPPEIVNTPEVFLVQDNIYTYEEAEPLCRAYGARLATMGDLYDAWKKGANWCSYGWVRGRKAVYPTQKKQWLSLQNSDNEQTRTKCGLPGLNGGTMRDPYARFGVHCFGVKPPTWRMYLANTMARDNLTEQERESRSKVSQFRKKLNQYTIVPWSDNRWSDVYTTNDDSQMGGS